jgi:hypothetical protein
MGLLFCRAYEVFRHQRYLDAALAAGDVVWQRGLLKKGLGLCHGIAGTNTHAPPHTRAVYMHSPRSSSDTCASVQAMGTSSWSC